MLQGYDPPTCRNQGAAGCPISQGWAARNAAYGCPRWSSAPGLSLGKTAHESWQGGTAGHDTARHGTTRHGRSAHPPGVLAGRCPAVPAHPRETEGQRVALKPPHGRPPLPHSPAAPSALRGPEPPAVPASPKTQQDQPRGHDATGHPGHRGEGALTGLPGWPMPGGPWSPLAPGFPGIPTTSEKSPCGVGLGSQASPCRGGSTGGEVGMGEGWKGRVTLGWWDVGPHTSRGVSPSRLWGRPDP